MSPSWHECVRVVGRRLRISWNGSLRRAGAPTHEQIRTVSAWGDRLQADIARLRVLVVGVGSVGLDVAVRLAATGIEQVGVMDYDFIKPINRDRVIGATRRDARVGTTKVALAERLTRAAATAPDPAITVHDLSVCSPEGLQIALDYDVIFSCVDRPWPRAMLNGVGYSDLIPVIDGGINIDPFPTDGMRGASWRVQTATPGVPCMVCSGQIRMPSVVLDQQGLLDNEEYIQQAGLQAPASQNVATLSASVSAGQLAQFVSLVASPARRGVSDPLRYVLAAHNLEHIDAETSLSCDFERRPGEGDNRISFVRTEGPWVDVLAARERGTRSFGGRLRRLNQRLLHLHRR